MNSRSWPKWQRSLEQFWCWSFVADDDDKDHDDDATMPTVIMRMVTMTRRGMIVLPHGHESPHLLLTCGNDIYQFQYHIPISIFQFQYSILSLLSLPWVTTLVTHRWEWLEKTRRGIYSGCRRFSHIWVILGAYRCFLPDSFQVFPFHRFSD